MFLFTCFASHWCVTTSSTKRGFICPSGWHGLLNADPRGWLLANYSERGEQIIEWTAMTPSRQKHTEAVDVVVVRISSRDDIVRCNDGAVLERIITTTTTTTTQNERHNTVTLHCVRLPPMLQIKKLYKNSQGSITLWS